MNFWDFHDGLDLETVIRWCSEDREMLSEEFFLARPEWEGKPAALWLEELLDLCRVRVRDCPLAPGQLGLCELSERTIYVNSRMSDFVHHSVDLEALRTSTLAHEFGHIRMHGEEDQENTFTFSYRGNSHFHHPRMYQREREADLYGALFLVPIQELRNHDVCARFLKYRKERRQLKPGTLWKGIYRMARDFRVSPSFMKRCLVELGWLENRAGSKGRKFLALRLGAGS